MAATDTQPGVAERPAELTDEQLLAIFRTMLTIRAFDSKVITVWQDAAIAGTSHPYIGMEAIAAGACAALRPDDYITSTHRGHGHCIAKGADVRLMMAELFGKATGLCKGKGGSMHIADLDLGMLGANGIVAGGVGIATGAALSATLRGSGQVALCFFGDGALNEGILHECCNLAAIWTLPVVFLCENNLYAMSARADRFTSVPHPSVRATAYGFHGAEVDGMDALAVYAAVRQAVDRARDDQGPSLVVCNAYRFTGHHVADPLNYRSKEEVEEWQRRDPIELLAARLLEWGVLAPEGREAMAREAAERVDEAVAFARQSPAPDPSALEEDLYV